MLKAEKNGLAERIRELEERLSKPSKDDVKGTFLELIEEYVKDPEKQVLRLLR